eukprot:10429199-Alexandrium_andersonii.AAC.1
MKATSCCATASACLRSEVTLMTSIHWWAPCSERQGRCGPSSPHGSEAAAKSTAKSRCSAAQVRAL